MPSCHHSPPHTLPFPKKGLVCGPNVVIVVASASWYPVLLFIIWFVFSLPQDCKIPQYRQHPSLRIFQFELYARFQWKWWQCNGKLGGFWTFSLKEEMGCLNNICFSLSDPQAGFFWMKGWDLGPVWGFLAVCCCDFIRGQLTYSEQKWGCRLFSLGFAEEQLHNKLSFVS